MAAQRWSGLWSMLSLALSVLAAVCVALSSAQQQPPPLPPQPAAPAMPSCPPVQASLSPCVSYFIGNSSSPSAECCSHMQSMFQSQTPCLCAALAAVPAQLGAMLGVLPSACNLPPNACADATSSVPAGGSAAPSSGTTATAAAAPATVPSGTIPASGGGSKSVHGMPDSAAVGAESSMGISAAIVLASSFLLAYVC